MKRQRGLSLLEILVAFTILSLSLGILMRIFSDGLRSVDISRDQAQAIALAQSLLATAGVEQPLAGGTGSGEVAGKFHWQLQVESFLDEPRIGVAENIRTLPVLELWQITAKVGWDDGGVSRSVVLTSLRAQKPQPS